MKLSEGYLSAFEYECSGDSSAALILPNRFDGCVEPLSRIFNIGLIRDHHRFDVGTPAVFDRRFGFESFPGTRSTDRVDRGLPFGRGQPFGEQLSGHWMGCLGVDRGLLR